MEEFDINKVISEFLSSQIDNIFNLGKDFIKGTNDTIQLSLKTVYKDYLTRSYQRYGKSKSFFIREDPVNLYDFYVPMGLVCNKIEIPSSNIKTVLDVNRCCIISGTGGAGKSIMLKHLFVDSLKLKKQIPIFVELRDLNSNDQTIEELIKETSSNFGLEIEDKFFSKALEKGHFILFLDGLDEVTKTKKEVILDEINKLTIKYPKLSVILSTRPDIKLSELDIFTSFKTLPLTKEQSVELIKKLPTADEDLRLKFISDLNNGLFEKHESFLSNPLLLSMMMLTYGFSADIPNKSSIFYDQAFQALFQRHDSFKGSYKRKRETNLDIRQFGKVFSAFCILSYEQRKFKFTKKEVESYLLQAQKITNIDFDIECYYLDLLQAVSLLIEDGMSIYFTHRSFQEYFATIFIVESNTERKIKLFNKYQKYASSDDVFELAREIDENFIDFEVVQPFIKNFFESINLKKNIGITNYLNYIKLVWERFEFKNGNLYGIVKDVKTKEMMYFIFYNVCKNVLTKELSDIDKSTLVREYKNKSLSKNKEFVFETKKMKTTDIIVKEIYKNGVLFSKSPLKVLQKANKDITDKKNNLEESLTDLLLND